MIDPEPPPVPGKNPPPQPAMEISQAAIDLVKSSEGFSHAVYRDSVGLPTVGYGHKLKLGESFPDGVTEAQATELLAADMEEACRAVLRLVAVPLTQGQLDALTDFCFNVGSGRLAGSTLLQKLNAGDYDGAREELLRWVYAGHKVMEALVTRRQREYELWNS